MKSTFSLILATAALVPTIGLALADSWNPPVNNSNLLLESPSLGVNNHPCSAQAFSAAQSDFAFYSDGTLNDGSPAIECNNLKLLQKNQNQDGTQSYDYSLRCYTLDRATQRNYWISEMQLANGECQNASLNSEDDSP